MVDLHTHSTYSDGSDTPRELVQKAKDLGLSAIALTDHNTIDGIAEFLDASNGEIEAIPGIEITTGMGDEDFHIIGLFVKPESYNDINSYLEKAIKRKIDSNKNLVNALNKAGYALSYDEIVDDYGSENFNRVTIANALIKKGYIKSIQEGFSDLLSEKRGFYIPPKRLDTFETIEFLSSIKALPIWAHPLKDSTFERLDNNHLPIAKKCGLVAMEVMHSSYNEKKTNQAKELAKKHNLLCSGGSDYHGTVKDNVLLGTGTANNVNVDDSILQQLKALI